MALYLGNIKIAGGSGSGNANIVSCDNYDDYIAKRDANFTLGKLSVTYYTPDDGQITPSILSDYAVLSGGNQISGENSIYCITASTTTTPTDLSNSTIIATQNGVSYNISIDKIISDIYPIGSIYFGTQSICPLTLMIPGSNWEKIGSKILTDIGTSISLSGTAKCKGNGKSLGVITKNYPSGTPSEFGIGVAADVSHNGGLLGINLSWFDKTASTQITPVFESNYIPQQWTMVGLSPHANYSGIVCDLSSAEVTAHFDSESSISLNIWKRIA